MSLRKELKKFSRTANIQYAIVEAVTNGLVTVVLAGTNSRLTNLSASDSNITVGDTVILDFSMSNIPIVKRIQGAIESDAIDLPLMGQSSNESIALVENIGFSAYHSISRNIGTGSWVALTFDSYLWDDSTFLQSGQIVIPETGLYLIFVNLAAQGFSTETRFYDTDQDDAWDKIRDFDRTEYFEAEVYGSNYGLIASDTVWPTEFSNTTPVTMSLSGPIPAIAGEVITVRVRAFSSYSYVTFPSSGYYFYPKISGQRQDLISSENDMIQDIIGGL